MYAPMTGGTKGLTDDASACYRALLGRFPIVTP